RPPSQSALVADRLHSAAIHLLRAVRRQDARLGIGPTGLSALSVLVFGGPRTMGALAAAEQVRPPTMSRLVATLERNGLVEREGDREDRRRTVVRATSMGGVVMRRGREWRVADLAERLQTLGGPDLALLARAADLMEGIATQNTKPRRIASAQPLPENPSPRR
ncbi:MAG: MarR family winged helix-turn-helix transcriptional regulator, partial [Gemmatimonadales bacterium]